MAHSKQADDSSAMGSGHETSEALVVFNYGMDKINSSSYGFLDFHRPIWPHGLLLSEC